MGMVWICGLGLGFCLGTVACVVLSLHGLECWSRIVNIYIGLYVDKSWVGRNAQNSRHYGLKHVSLNIELRAVSFFQKISQTRFERERTYLPLINIDGDCLKLLL